MTRLLQKAFSEASKLPDAEQNIIAKWLMDEIQSERKWDELFSESEDALARLAQEALEEEEAGKTTELNLNQL